MENVQNLMWTPKMQIKIDKKSFVSEIILSELVTLNRLSMEENTCHHQSSVNKES